MPENEPLMAFHLRVSGWLDLFESIRHPETRIHEVAGFKKAIAHLEWQFDNQANWIKEVADIKESRCAEK